MTKQLVESRKYWPTSCCTNWR